MDKVGEFERRVFSSVSKWMDFIKTLGTPESDEERTRFQYLSINQFSDKKILFMKNLLSLPLIVFTFIGTLLYGNRKKWHIESVDSANIVVITTNSKHRPQRHIKDIPEELIKEFGNAFEYMAPKGKTFIVNGCLDKIAIQVWIGLIKKYPFSFYMNLSALTHLAFVGRMIKEFKPTVILTTESENDFNTSLLSKYCEENGVEYIGIMHGETYLNPNHAFVRFSRFYVWDEKYMLHYVITGSNREFFRVYKTNRFTMNIPENSKKESYVTYYLQGQNEAQMRSICRVLKKLTEKGKKCKVRLHPRATDTELVYKVFGNSDIEVESPDTPIEISYSSTEYIVSMYSTVLSEANENGLKAVIDDVSDITIYRQLNDIMYVNLDKISRRLSELIREVG